MTRSCREMVAEGRARKAASDREGYENNEDLPPRKLCWASELSASSF
jgi:hypothetical protein